MEWRSEVVISALGIAVVLLFLLLSAKISPGRKKPPLKPLSPLLGTLSEGVWDAHLRYGYPESHFDEFTSWCTLFFNPLKISRLQILLHIWLISKEGGCAVRFVTIWFTMIFFSSVHPEVNSLRIGCNIFCLSLARNQEAALTFSRLRPVGIIPLHFSCIATIWLTHCRIYVTTRRLFWPEFTMWPRGNFADSHFIFWGASVDKSVKNFSVLNDGYQTNPF